MPSLKIGTRKSELARTQTQTVLHALEKAGYSAQEHFVVTKGDIDKRPLSQISGDGFFTKEIEKHLLLKHIHMAVHSSKDLPSMTHKYLPWVAFGEREQNMDVLIRKKNQDVKTIGTSSPRRTSQLKQHFPNCKIVDIRGNVPTRIEKVRDGIIDATVLAKAGINRLKLEDFIYEQGLEIEELPFTTAPCQGILGVQAYFEYQHILEKITNLELTNIAHAEKSILALLGGGCHLSVGVHIQKKEEFHLDFFYDDQSTLHNHHLQSKRLGDLVRSAYSKVFSDKIGNPKGRVWLTQPIQHQHSVAKKLAEKNYQAICWPLIEIQTVWDPQQLDKLNLKKYEGIVFSSQFAAQIFLLEWAYQSTDRLEKLKNMPIFSVGKSTSKILQELTVTEAPEATSNSLSKILPKTRKPYLIPGTPMTRMASELAEQKIPFEILSLYESFPSKSPLRTDIPNVQTGDKIVLTSPSAVEQFIVECKANAALESLQVFTIGPTTARAIEKHGIKHQMSRTPGSWDRLIEELE